MKSILNVPMEDCRSPVCSKDKYSLEWEWSVMFLGEAGN